MMTSQEREVCLQKMDEEITRFYRAAIRIGNHPFIEFAGVMAAYLKTCQRAHEQGIDFTECNRHSGRPLPMEGFEVTYLSEKLNCIFDGRIVGVERADQEPAAMKAIASQSNHAHQIQHLLA